MPSWHDLLRPDEPGKAQESPETKKFAELCSIVFTTAAGKELMEMMRKQTIERRTRYGAPEAALREDEAARRFVALLQMMTARGLETASKEKAKPA